MVAPAVAVVQPVHQHAYETVLAAQEAGLLHSFVTEAFSKSGALPLTRLAALAPSLAARAERARRRRWDPRLDVHRVVDFRRYFVLEMLTRALRQSARAPLAAGEVFNAFDRRAARWLRTVRPRPRVVHAFEGSGLHSLVAAKEIGAVAVLDVTSLYERYVEVDGLPPNRWSRRQGDRIRAERAAADLLLVPSRLSEEHLLGQGPVRGRVLRLPYGVDVSRFSGSRSTASGVFRALYVGQLSRRKGLGCLLDAWRIADLPHSELLLVGGASAHGRDLLRNAPGSVRWIPHVPKADVHRWYADAEVFLFPSLADSFGLVVYEAMAAGLPVLTTDAVGAELVEGEHGWVVPAGDTDAFVEKLKLLHARRDDAALMGERGRSFVQGLGGWDVYRRRLGELYQQLVSIGDPSGLSWGLSEP